MFLNLGPNHPSAHGAFRIVLQLDGEEIVDCVPDIGYHHRGAEKMAERQSLAQLHSLHRPHRLSRRRDEQPAVRAGGGKARRHQGAGARRSDPRDDGGVLPHHEPPAATWAPTSRTSARMTPVFFIFTDRQKAYDVIEAITGFRMHPAWYRIGGVAHDLPRGWEKLVREFLDWMPKRLDEYEKAALKNSILIGAHHGCRRTTTPRKRSSGASPVPVCAPPAATSTCARRAPTPATRTSTSKCRWRANGDAYDRCMVRDGGDAPEPAHHRAVPATTCRQVRTRPITR